VCVVCDMLMSVAVCCILSVCCMSYVGVWCLLYVVYCMLYIVCMMISVEVCCTLSVCCILYVGAWCLLCVRFLGMVLYVVYHVSHDVVVCCCMLDIVCM